MARRSFQSTAGIIALATLTLVLASMAASTFAFAQPDGFDRPTHPGGRIEVRGVRSGPLTGEDLEPVFAVIPDRLRACARTRFRSESAGMTAASHGFQLTIDARGRGTTDGLQPDPDDPPHVRAWLACARRVVRRLRFPTRDAPSLVMLSLIWTNDDGPPSGGGLL